MANIPNRRSLFVLATVLLCGCIRSPSVRTLEQSPSVSDARTKFHMRDGSLYVLESYNVEGPVIVGNGSRFSDERRLLERGHFTIPRGDVALVETTNQSPQPGVIALAVVSGASLAVTAACIAAPKACFGSCPTFYVPGRGGWQLQAEGFSGSIASALEENDVDDLPQAEAADHTLTLAMRNEALETHAIRRLRLHTVAGPAGSTVLLRARGGYAAATSLTGPESCSVDAQACAAMVAPDEREYSPRSDGVDLASRTSIELHFAPPGSREVAIAYTGRNSLMSTFVLYHLMALYGHAMGEFIAAVERHDLWALRALWRFNDMLGGIDVAVRQGSDGYHDVGRIGYIGPIARGTRMVSAHVDDPNAPLDVRLTFVRAHWKFDAVRIGPLVADDLNDVTSDPEVIDPGRFDAAATQASVRGSGEHLVTLPGDEVRFRFRVPETTGAVGYFLESRGYYYEWMRREWLRDENIPRARSYIEDPPLALREMAQEYHRIEPSIDAIFAASRFTRRGAQ